MESDGKDDAIVDGAFGEAKDEWPSSRFLACGVEEREG